MSLLLVSFLAGALTVLAPCILPLLPVVVGSSLIGRSKTTPYVIILSLSLSIIAFTFLLKVSTLFIAIPTVVWGYLSGTIVVGFGLTLVFPALWEKLPGVRRLNTSANGLLGAGYQKKNWRGDALVGVALGPIFSTCSPTYFLILASVLPASVWLGSLYLFAYVLGLAVILLLIAHYGDRLTQRLLPIADGRGTVKRVIGGLLIVVGIAIVTGYDKKVETWLIDNGVNFIDLEYQLLDTIEVEAQEPVTVPVVPKTTTISDHVSEPTTEYCGEGGQCTTTDAVLSEEIVTTPTVPDVNKTPIIDTKDTMVATTPLIPDTAPLPRATFTELVTPNAYLNTDGAPITIGEQLPGKVVLVSFMTYSCVNCQRTFSHLQEWYTTYKDDGLVVIGIHTPEFAFERNTAAVQKALDGYGITFPVVLDNDYQTWQAYGNRYWPRRYLIDRDGTVVFDHIGEGKYAETEALIRQYLGVKDAR